MIIVIRQRAIVKLLVIVITMLPTKRKRNHTFKPLLSGKLHVFAVADSSFNSRNSHKSL